MQLTKNDANRIYDSLMDKKGKRYLDFSKFQQVVAFYEKYKNNPLELMRDRPEILPPEIHTTMSRKEFKDWLFHYCFVEGLK